MKRHRLGTIFALFLAAALAVTSAVSAVSVEAYAFTENTGDGESSAQDALWYESIPEMLTAGDYEEGVVIAGIDMSKAKNPEDPGSALETKKLRAGTEELLEVDTEALAAEQDASSWLKDLKDDISEQQDDGICITSIQRTDMTTEQILWLLASDDSVVFAEPNYTIDMSSQEDDNSGSDGNAPKAGSGTVPDVSGLQWSSSEDASLHASDKAESVSVNVPGWPEGSNMDNPVIVAVADYPVDFSNPDLSDRAYTFSPELKETLGCDDHGFNATWESKDGKLELFGGDHGTHVAGIIGASWDGKGISGVGSDVQLVSVQISNDDGKTSLINALRGYSFIKNAVENGVEIRVTNNSWGLVQTSKALDAAVTELGNHGVISCFAAGNDSVDMNAAPDIDSLLANNPYAIIVASTTPSGELAASSNYGKGVVTLGAPGAGILSCVETQSVSYIPALAEQNKVYENFEAAEPGTAGQVSVNICQVGYDTDIDEDGLERSTPNPDNRISGTEGVVVTGSGEMGFEGRNALKIKIDKSHLGGGDGATLALRMDFGDVSALDVSAGDSFGFAYGGKTVLEPVRTFDTASGSEPMVTLYEKNNENCWNTFEYTLEAGIDKNNLSIVCEITAVDADEIYLDTIGIGNDKQPYLFASGTSMASPAVAGAAAVIASRHYSELEGLDAPDSAAKLANLVRSSVRPIASLRDVTSTGGIIDLSVDTNIPDTEDQKGPDIKEVTVSGRNVRLTGTGFGDTKGTAVVRKYIAGAHSNVGASVRSWNDNAAVLTLSKDFEGIMEIVLTASNGKRDTIVKYISRSSNLFEQDHHIGSDTGEPFEINEPGPSDDIENLGDFETTGILVAGDSKLYYMPQLARVEKNPAYRSMYCYDPDIDSWTACPAYPSWIRNASGAWFDGKLYVKGTAVNVDESGDIPYYDPEDDDPVEVFIYSYSPGENTWKKCASEGVASEHTLFTAGSRLMLAGVESEVTSEGKITKWTSDGDDSFTVLKKNGTEIGLTFGAFTRVKSGYSPAEGDTVKVIFLRSDMKAKRIEPAGTGDSDEEDDFDDMEDEGYPTVREYDPSAGAGKALGYSPCSQANPKAAYAGGRIYLCDYEYWNTVYVLDDNMSAGYDDTIELPEFYNGDGERSDEEPTVLGDRDFVLTSYGDTLILTGPAARDGSSDTFVLKAGENEFKPCTRRISDAEVLMPSAAMLDGRLYVIGASIYEPDMRIFRSTVPAPVKPAAPAVKKGKTYSVGGQKYTVTALASGKTQGKVTFKKAKNAKKVTVPATVKLADGKKYKVTVVDAKAFTAKKIRTITIGANVSKIKKNTFKSSKAAKLIVKTKKLTKSGVKGSLKGSKIKTVKVNVGSKAQNKKFVKKYKKIFTKKNAGKKVTIK